MKGDHTDDLRIVMSDGLMAPAQLLRDFPASVGVRRHVRATRNAIHQVLHGQDDRLVVVVGPCSIHDTKAALDYANRLKRVANELAENLIIIMRVYFEKPRTTVGWKGLINDPHLDESFDINEGLLQGRQLLIDINEIGLPCATEFLDLISPQYLVDLIAWGAIGARTTESPSHRQLASGLSCPVGFKNGTSGGIQIAVDAIKASAAAHSFIGITKTGQAAVVRTAGNPDTHVILRGGDSGPNYRFTEVSALCDNLSLCGLRPRVMIDLSHANSGKRHEHQLSVGDDVSKQIADGNHCIIGVMIESHLRAGRQDLVAGKPLKYGLSITDACLGWNDTVPLLEQLADSARQRRSMQYETFKQVAR
jgi:3-deoxy-7-phosphoheptulonate synthase